MTTPGATLKPAQSATFQLEIPITAPPATVWDSLTRHIDEWWLPDFRVTGSPRAIVLEPHVGGRVYEDAGDDQGLLWFHVLSLSPGQSMHLGGHICPPFGGPSFCQMYLELAEQNEGTDFKVTVALVGNVDEAGLAEIESGWRLLFGSLQSHAEGQDG